MTHPSRPSSEPPDDFLKVAEASERRWRAVLRFLTPAAIGAVALGALTGIRVAITLFSGRADLVALGMMAVAIAMGAGATGGLVYAALGRPLRRRGRLGAYGAGIVTVTAYVLAGVIAAGAVDSQEELDLRDGTVQFAVGFTSLLFGTLLGREFASDTPKRRRRDRDAAI